MTKPEDPADQRDRSAQRFVDEVAGGEVDWKGAVRLHPIPTLLLAALGGFFLGRRYGWQLVDDVSAYAADELVQQLQGALEGGLSGDRQ